MNRRRTIAAVLIVSCLIMMSLDFREGPIRPIKPAVSSAVYPFQVGTQMIANPIANFFSAIGDVATLRSQVERLEQDNAELRNVAVSLADITKQNEDLRSLLNMGSRQKLRLLSSEVISFAPGDLERSIIINAGYQKGVGVGMAVVNDQGIIGVVNQVAINHASVDLLSSSLARLVVRDAKTGVRGTLVGQGTGPMALTIVDAGNTIPAGSEFVTQAFTGSAIPGGIPVGQLENTVETTLHGDTQFFVRPYADLRTLQHVGVVLGEQAPDGTFEDVLTVDPNTQPIPDFGHLPEPKQIHGQAAPGQVQVDEDGNPLPPGQQGVPQQSGQQPGQQTGQQAGQQPGQQTGQQPGQQGSQPSNQQSQQQAGQQQPSGQVQIQPRPQQPAQNSGQRQPAQSSGQQQSAQSSGQQQPAQQPQGQNQ